VRLREDRTAVLHLRDGRRLREGLIFGFKLFGLREVQLLRLQVEL